MARNEFPSDRILRGKSLQNLLGPDGKPIPFDRQPEVTVLDQVTGRVKKVYEAARKDSSGNWVERELLKKADYDRVGIPSHFEEVP